MNSLRHETSPYLLQHLHNPVNWMPWGDAAFETARSQNKPVLISIGYASCHWCHVMAHESFEDEETARLMNELFINIKVDREEYPDVDHVYMDAVQAMSGSGGWPLNVFATPDKKPFYGGTYFPPQRAHGRPSWREVLINVSSYYAQNREEAEKQAVKLMEHLKQQSGLQTPVTGHPDPDHKESCKKMRDQIMAQADREHGGFGQAPKFPSTFCIQYLLDHHVLFEDEEALNHALRSLDKMMMGGIYDHLAGGFSRYSTDRHWIVPHFEKMLYDNALLIEIFSIAYSITKNAAYKSVIHKTVQWLKDEMMNDEGGFYSALDADSEGVEGKYYTWSFEELQNLLGDDADRFCKHYQVTDKGNWENTNILYNTYEGQNQLTKEHEGKLEYLRAVLSTERKKRVRPLTDDKIILGWNALMSKALIQAAVSCEEKEFQDLAERNIQFLLEKFRNNDSLYFHTGRGGSYKIPAYLDDLVFLADALMMLGVISGCADYYQEAKEIVTYADEHFLEQDKSLYQFTSRQFAQFEIQKLETHDGALPSSNAIMASVLKRLSIIFQESRWARQSEIMMQDMSPYLSKYTSSFAKWASHRQNWSVALKEVSICGKSADDFFLRLHNKMYRPDVLYFPSQDESGIEYFKDKYQPGETLIFICRDFTCLPPFRDTNEAFIEIIGTHYDVK